MKNIATIIAILLLIACTTPMNINLNPQLSPVETQNIKIPYKVGLLLTSEFTKFTYNKHLTKELSDLNYNLGTASKSLLIQTIMQTAKATKIVNSTIDNTSDIIVEPKIISFSETHPPVLNTGKYTATISYKVKVYNNKGKLIKEQTINGVAEINGRRTHNPSDNYSAVASKAIEDGIIKIVKFLSKIKI